MMTWFANRNTVHKLTLSFGLCVALALIIGLIALTQMARMNRSTEEIAVNSLSGTATLAETLSDIEQIRILEWRRILTPDNAGQSRVEALMKSKLATVERHLATYAMTATQREDKKNYRELREHWKAYLASHVTLMALNRSGDLLKLSNFMQGKSNENFDAVAEVLARMLAWNKDNGQLLAKDAMRTYVTARMLVLGLLLLAVGAGIGMAYRVTQSIAPPLNQMAAVAGRVAVGDVRQTISYNSRDEVGRLAESLRAMLSYHKEMSGVAAAIADGDLTQKIVAKSEEDMLGHTFNRMIANLRRLVETITTKSEALEQSEERYRSVVDNVREVIFTMDIGGQWTLLNPAWTAITGYSVKKSLGQKLLHFVSEDDRPRIKALYEALLRREKDYCRHEIRFRTKEQGVCWVEARIQSILDAQGEISGFFGTLSDITERKQAEAQLHHLALHDALTGLPNRLLFQDRLRGALGRMQREQKGIAVLFLDLDNFKYVNDSMGHEAGDTLLKTIASHLQTCARLTDTIARLGGDEFTLLLEGLHNIQEAAQIADRIVAQLQQPISLGERRVFASASIGITYCSDPATDPDDLLRDADIAMYQAKTKGKSGYALFDNGMRASAMERVEIETGLRFALERGELRVHYQPLIDLETGAMSGAEALVRWEHPALGLMPPGQFVPIAEETGLILPIGYWVLEEACRQRQTWKAAYPDHPPFIINVNLSGKQLMREDVVERVHDIVKKTGIAPSELKLEITESVMMTDVKDTVSKLTRLKALGVQLAMDDFGTGYSSMASLSLFPLDTVKIDRSFISQLETNGNVRSVIAAIVMLSKAMNLNVTGEGLETEDQVTFLQGLGCHTGQGYYFARPLTAEALNEDMASRKDPCIRSASEANMRLIQEMLATL